MLDVAVAQAVDLRVSFAFDVIPPHLPLLQGYRAIAVIGVEHRIGDAQDAQPHLTENEARNERAAEHQCVPFHRVSRARLSYRMADVASDEQPLQLEEEL